MPQVQIKLSELITLVYDRVENNDRFYPRAEVVDAINEGMKVFNLYMGFLQRTVTLLTPSIANRFIYDVPAPIILPMRVNFAGRLLDPYSLENISHSLPTWMQETSAQVGFPPDRWVPIGIDKFAIHPADSIGGAVMTMTGVIEPPVLSADNDKVIFPVEIAQTFSDYCAHVIQLDEGGTTFNQSMKIYEDFINEVATETYLMDMKQRARRSLMRSPR